MIGAVKKIGNSAGIVIPKPILAQVGARAGDAVEMRVEGNRIVIEPIRRISRAGWAEDAMAISSEGEAEAPEWLEFGNEDDAELAW